MLLNPYRFGVAPTPVPGDPFWANVVSLIQGADGPVDVLGNAVTLIDSPTYTDRLFTIKDSHDAIRVAGASGAFAFGTGNFCIELYLKGSTTNTNYQMMFDSTGNGSTIGGLYAEYAQRGAFFSNGDAGGGGGTSGPGPDNVEHHLALVRQGTTMCFATDGVWGTNRTVSANILNPTGHMAIGNYANSAYAAAGLNEFRGWRVTKGVGRYTIGTPFVVPTLPYPESA